MADRGYDSRGTFRNEDDLRQIREYIASNPANWAIDEDNPDCLLVKGN